MLTIDLLYTMDESSSIPPNIQQTQNNIIISGTQISQDIENNLVLEGDVPTYNRPRSPFDSPPSSPILQPDSTEFIENTSINYETSSPIENINETANNSIDNITENSSLELDDIIQKLINGDILLLKNYTMISKYKNSISKYLSSFPYIIQYKLLLKYFNWKIPNISIEDTRWPYLGKKAYPFWIIMEILYFIERPDLISNNRLYETDLHYGLMIIKNCSINHEYFKILWNYITLSLRYIKNNSHIWCDLVMKVFTAYNNYIYNINEKSFYQNNEQNNEQIIARKYINLTDKILLIKGIKSNIHFTKNDDLNISNFIKWLFNDSIFTPYPKYIINNTY
jgi:hypothetical protein